MKNYKPVHEILASKDVLLAKNYLKELWYAIEEEYFSLSTNYKVYKQQIMHLRASAPVNWSLNWNGSQFYLSTIIENHSVLHVSIKSNGHVEYLFS